MATDNIDQEFEADAAPKKSGAKKSADGLSGKKVRLTIHKSQDKNAVKDVFIGLNGVGYRIVRGEEVIVPEEVANVLTDAVELRVEQEADGTLTHREVPSYPFSVKPV